MDTYLPRKPTSWYLHPGISTLQEDMGPEISIPRRDLGPEIPTYYPPLTVDRMTGTCENITFPAEKNDDPINKVSLMSCQENTSFVDVKLISFLI